MYQLSQFWVKFWHKLSNFPLILSDFYITIIVNMWRALHIVKGALDKYDIYLFISNSVEDFKLDLYWNFQLILPMYFILWGILWTALSS